MTQAPSIAPPAAILARSPAQQGDPVGQAVSRINAGMAEKPAIGIPTAAICPTPAVGEVLDAHGYR